MALVGTVAVNFKGDSSGVDAATKSILAQLNHLNKSAHALSGNMKNAFKLPKVEAPQGGGADGLMGMLKGAAVGLGVKATAGFLIDAAKNAERLGAASKGLGMILGPGAALATREIERLASTLGAARQESMAAASVIGATLVNVGKMGGEAAGGQTAELLRVSADMAATFGRNMEEAAGAVASFLRGERDPIEAFGISINEAAINSELLRSGVQKVNGEFTTQQKLLASINLLMDQTAKYKGAAAAAADTATASIARMNDSLGQMGTTIGSTVAPAISYLADGVTGTIQMFQFLGELIGNGGKLEETSAGKAAALAQVTDHAARASAAVEKVADAIATVQAPTQAATDELKKFLNGLTEVEKMQKSLNGEMLQLATGASDDVMGLARLAGTVHPDKLMQTAAMMDQLTQAKQMQAMQGDFQASLANNALSRPELATARSSAFFQLDMAARNMPDMGARDPVKRTAENTGNAVDQLKRILALMERRPELATEF
jgi:hypothetical protein